MRTLSALFIALSLSLVVASPASAKDGPKKKDKEAASEQKLSDEEKEERKAKKLARLDTDGDGVISDAEKKAAKQSKAKDKKRDKKNKDV